MLLHNIPREDLGIPERLITAIRAYQRDFHDRKIVLFTKSGVVVGVGWRLITDERYPDSERLDNERRAIDGWVPWLEEHVDNWVGIAEYHSHDLPEFDYKWIAKRIEI